MRFRDTGFAMQLPNQVARPYHECEEKRYGHDETNAADRKKPKRFWSVSFW
jgi:hypothetical protein